MFIIDVSLKNTPVTFSVQRKTAEDAEALYQQLLEALRSGHPAVMEFTCEHQFRFMKNLRPQLLLVDLLVSLP